MEWYKILEEIKNSKGKQKQLVLEKNKDNEELKKVLYFLYNPRFISGISKKKFDKIKAKDKKYLELDSKVKYIINYLSLISNTGRDIDVENVKNCIDYNNELEATYLKQLIIKDCPIGISANTINKVFHDLIPVFKLMKGTKWDGEDLNFKNFTVSLKLDGNSATCFHLKNGETYFLSRSGAIMEGLDHLIKVYDEYLPRGFVYCGELLCKNYSHLEHGDLFRVSNGITNSKEEKKENLQHVIFDMIPYNEYEANIFTENFSIRKNRIINHTNEYDPYGDDYYNISHVPYYDVKTLNDITNKLEEVNKKGLEGLMINDNDSKYKFGKQKCLLKVKEFYTMDLPVVGIKKHIRKETTGCLVVDFKGNDVGVPSMPDILRDKFWNNQDDIIGKIIEVKYFRETENKQGKKSLRFPSFVRVREDKTIDDISFD